MQSCETVNEDLISKSSKETHKSNIKAKITIAAFKYLIEKQSKHSKVKDIKYTKLETQQYMKSPLFTNEEVSLLYKLNQGPLIVRAILKTITDKMTSFVVFVMKRKKNRYTY